MSVTTDIVGGLGLVIKCLSFSLWSGAGHKADYKLKHRLLILNDVVTFTAVPPLGAFSFLSASALPEAVPPPM